MKTASILMLSLVLAAGFGLNACSRSENVEASREPAADRPNNLTADDKMFIDYAAGMHAGEVMLAELAKQKSSTDDIKSYADAVIDSHTDALKRLEDATGEDRTSGNTSASDDTKSHADYLTTLSGAQFDREFIALMIADHKDAAGTFQAPFVTVQNNDLKNYMRDTASDLEENLHAAEKLKK
jgi:putative membrane protein